jgi:hypothetical protein
MDKVYAPWAACQVDSLNGFQRAACGQPFVCPNRHPDSGQYSNHLLTATSDGWRCRTCDYRLDWAWHFMADWSWRKAPSQRTGSPKAA